MSMGMHIIANFYNCIEKEMLVNKIILEKTMEDLIKKEGLNIIKKNFHKFKNAGVTGIFLISESHISIHTWPEKNNFLSLDIFTCNFSENNDNKTKALFQDFIKLFKPKKIKVKAIKR